MDIRLLSLNANNLSNDSPSIAGGRPAVQVIAVPNIFANSVANDSPYLDSGPPKLSLMQTMMISASVRDATGASASANIMTQRSM